MFENIALRGMLSVMGAFLISLGVGVMYLWGIITIYGTSYFRLTMKDTTLTEDQTDIIFPLMLLGQVLASPLRLSPCPSSRDTPRKYPPA
jgi:hypothetical protein